MNACAAPASEVIPALPRVVAAQGAWLEDDEGGRWLDMVNGFGAVFLGHADATVAAAVQGQLGRVWAAGRLRTDARDAAEQRLQALLPPGMQLAGLYSTGMEAVEFALRVALLLSGRRQLLAFARSMHGKSALTAGLAWPNALLRPAGMHTLPAPQEVDDDTLLARLDAALAPRQVAAVLVEPLQGSNAGHAFGPELLADVAALCRRHGSLLLLDEVLTGLYRTGPCFVAGSLPSPPDLLVFGKSLANGLPCSAVALGPGLRVPAEALPGSTFAGNALVGAAVLGTLQALHERDVAAAVQAIESELRRSLAPLDALGVRVRGRGALWSIELPSAVQAARAEALLRAQRVLVGCNGSALRLLPSLAAEPVQLSTLGALLVAACATALAEGRA